MSWTHIPDTLPCHNGILQGYSIFYYGLDYDGNRAETNRLYIHNITINETIIGNITIGYIYGLSASGFTVKGPGNESDAVFVNTAFYSKVLYFV